MNFESLSLKGAYRVILEPFEDHRGHFARISCRHELARIGHQKEFVQINHSFTRKPGALRGIHFQHPPKSEIKMVTCLRGSVYDVIVDIREESPSFLNWHGEILSEDNNTMMYIPEGFAHGFQTLAPDTALLYLHTEFYDPQYEGGIRFDDPAIGIHWPREITDISERDTRYPKITNGFKGVTL